MRNWLPVYSTVGAGFGFGTSRPLAQYAEIFAGRRFVALSESGKWIFNRETARDTTAIEQEFAMLTLLADDAGIAATPKDPDQADELFDFAPRMLQAASGNPYALVDGGLWTARNYLEAEETFDWRNLTWRENHCFLAGQTLARFHRWGAKMKAASPTKLSCLRPEVDYETVCIRRLSEQIGDLPQAKSAHLIHCLQKALSDAGKTAQSYSPIHGDFHPGNVLFSKGSVRAVIDWDFSRLGDLLFDLAYARLMFAGKFRDVRLQSAVGEIDPELQALFHLDLLAAFEKGYYSRQFEGASAGLRQVCPLPLSAASTKNNAVPAQELDLPLALRSRTVLVMALILAFEMEEFKSQAYAPVERKNRAAIIENLFDDFSCLSC